jgi:cytochrome c5
VKLHSALRVAFIILFVARLAAAAQNSNPQQPPPAKTKHAPAQAPTNDSAEGEKRFETNCGRCHVPPENLSPREAKAVLRHMRVRANLSAEDERLILKYLAP